MATNPVNLSTMSYDQKVSMAKQLGISFGQYTTGPLNNKEAKYIAATRLNELLAAALSANNDTVAAKIAEYQKLNKTYQTQKSLQHLKEITYNKYEAQAYENGEFPPGYLGAKKDLFDSKKATKDSEINADVALSSAMSAASSARKFGSNLSANIQFSV